MLLVRIAVIVFVVWIVLRLMRFWRHSASVRRSGTEHGGEIVACEVCGVYFPKGDGVRDRDGRLTCGQHH